MLEKIIFTYRMRDKAMWRNNEKKNLITKATFTKGILSHNWVSGNILPMFERDFIATRAERLRYQYKASLSNPNVVCHCLYRMHLSTTWQHRHKTAGR